MTRKYLALGKLLVAILALGTPVLFFQGYRNQRELVLRDAQFKASLSEERDLMVRQMVAGFFQSDRFVGNARYKREMPDGPLEGLPPLPEPEVLAQIANIELVPESRAEARFLEFLYAADHFPSGMPKRFAGLVELMRAAPLSLDELDYQRLYRVALEFWSGRGLANETFAFLIQRLPQPMRALFEHHLIFLTEVYEPLDRHFWARVERDGYQYLQMLQHEELEELNQILSAFDYDLRFVVSDCWTDWGQAQVTIESEPLAPEARLRESRLAYLGMGAAVELAILMVFAVLTRYEKVHQTQRRLLATTSHELRTPLAVMRQFSEMLIDRASSFQPKHQNYHQHIYRECVKMQLLVENLLSAARIENFKPRPEPRTFDLEPWLREIAQSIERLDEENEIRLDCPSLQVRWDPAMMNQVVVNLLENARTHAGTGVEIHASVQGKRVKLCVRDFGTGAKLEQLRRIRAFNSVTRPHNGLGLGLYLCDQIIRAHGGTMGFEQADPGLRVTLLLPLWLEEPRADSRKTKGGAV